MTLLAAIVACAALAATIAAGSRARRALALGVAALALPLPFVVPATPPILRFIGAAGAAWGLVRVLDLVREARPRPWPLRLWHGVALFDTRDARRVPAIIEVATLAQALLYLAVAAMGLVMVHAADGAGSAALRWPLRWLGGAEFVYGMAESVAAVFRFAYRAAGVAIPDVHRFPLGARSIADFWGQRWNRVVGKWLREALFVPLARRGRAPAAFVAAFALSGALHAYMALPAVGIRMAATMAAFFLAQGVLVLIERRAGVDRWRPLPARAWFLAAMLASSPLFVEPMLRVVLPPTPSGP